MISKIYNSYKELNASTLPMASGTVIDEEIQNTIRAMKLDFSSPETFDIVEAQKIVQEHNRATNVLSEMRKAEIFNKEKIDPTQKRNIEKQFHDAEQNYSTLINRFYYGEGAPSEWRKIASLIGITLPNDYFDI